MDKKYIENAKKNIDIWIYSVVASFAGVMMIDYFLDKAFDFILYDKYQLLLGMVLFICSFNALKSARKNNEQSDQLDDIDEIKDAIKKKANSAKDFVHNCTDAKTEEETPETNNSSTEESVEETLSEDNNTDEEEITLPVYALEDEEKAEPPKEDDEINIDTPLQWFIVGAGLTAIVLAVIYFIASIICGTYPTDMAIGVAVFITVIVGALAALGTRD